MIADRTHREDREDRNITTSTEIPTTLARRFVDEAYNGGDLALLDELCAPDYAVHDPAVPQARDVEGYKEALRTFRFTAMPDLHMTIEDMVATGDRVAVRWTARGTMTGELAGMAPTGKSTTVAGMTIHRIAGGKLAETWWNWDALGMFQQLGLAGDTPAETAPPAAAERSAGRIPRPAGRRRRA